MSALGHKRTFLDVHLMSALPLKAGIDWRPERILASAAQGDRDRERLLDAARMEFTSEEALRTAAR